RMARKNRPTFGLLKDETIPRRYDTIDRRWPHEVDSMAVAISLTGPATTSSVGSAADAADCADAAPVGADADDCSAGVGADRLRRSRIACLAARTPRKHR